MDANLPVGLFDSGVGGLTVLAALRERMPQENFLYLGDTARLPYGTKSSETISRYAVQAAQALVQRRVKMLVIACNTASAVALNALRAAYADIPVIGVIEPGAEAACAASTSGHIAVIATESTIRGAAYQQAILRRRPDARIAARACSLFVPLAEEGWLDGALVEGIAARYLDPLFHPLGKGAPVLQQVPAQIPDCLVLGCTHFPLLVRAIRAVVGQDVQLVDSALTTAEAVYGELLARGLLRPVQATSDALIQGATHFMSTDDVVRFSRMGTQFLGLSISPSDVELVDL